MGIVQCCLELPEGEESNIKEEIPETSTNSIINDSEL